MRRREFICLFGAMAAAWSIAAYAQESATMPATSGTTASLPQIEVARVKPVDQVAPNVRLSDDLTFRAPRGSVVPGGHHCARRPPSTNVSASGKLVHGRSSRSVIATGMVIE
jgi:hypothetical protein